MSLKKMLPMEAYVEILEKQSESTSMRLSKTGFKCLSEKVTGFSLYEITLNKPITPKQLIQLERLLTEPYSITSLTTIWVHSETDAIMLRLNSGNLGMYLDSLQDS